MEGKIAISFLLSLMFRLTFSQAHRNLAKRAALGSEHCPSQPSAECSYVPGSCLCALSKYYMGGFSMAVNDCKKYLSRDGGNHGLIASIHSQEENDKFHELIKDEGIDAWIGLQFGNGPQWHDGTPVTYTNWEDPQNTGGIGADYEMVAESGKWRPITNINMNLRATCRMKYGPQSTTESQHGSTAGPTAAPQGCPNIALVIGVNVAVVVLLVTAVVGFLVWRRIQRRQRMEGYSHVAQNAAT